MALLFICVRAQRQESQFSAEKEIGHHSRKSGRFD
jgi:hypothetical protein